MRIRQAIIIPAILVLGTAGSALIGSAIPAAAASTPIVISHSTGLSVGTGMFYHG